MLISTQLVSWQCLPDRSTSYISCMYQCMHYSEDHCSLINLQRSGQKKANFRSLAQRTTTIQQQFNIFHAEFGLKHNIYILSAFKPWHNEHSLYWYWVFRIFATNLSIRHLKWRQQIWSRLSSRTFALSSTGVSAVWMRSEKKHIILQIRVPCG